MITYGELITGTTFCDAARAGWKEITGKELAVNEKLGQTFWDVLQKDVEHHRYENTRIGTAFRAGRCGFHVFLDLTGEEIGLRTSEFRLHPIQQRIETGFDILMQLCRQSGFKRLSTSIVSGYSVQYGETLSEVQRGYLMGFFQEFFEWASQGRVYPIIQKDNKGFCFAAEPLNL